LTLQSYRVVISKLQTKSVANCHGGLTVLRGPERDTELLTWIGLWSVDLGQII